MTTMRVTTLLKYICRRPEWRAQYRVRGILGSVEGAPVRMHEVLWGSCGRIRWGKGVIIIARVWQGHFAIFDPIPLGLQNPRPTMPRIYTTLD